MCGICGLVGEFRPGLAERMNAAQSHRGPDGQGIFEDAKREVALGHVRLAILDLSDNASQPMTSRSGRFVLVFNGEIYNYRELRSTLTDDSSLRSSGDTEVLLRGLEEKGIDFIEQLNGMFAFALWDNRERELLLVRDPLGIKPLYYTEPQARKLLFASEIKAICAHPYVRREPDFAALRQHLAFCHPSGNRTALRGIRRLPPGSMLRWKASERKPRITRYWQACYSEETSASHDEAVIELQQQIESAVARQLVSDVPVGTFLSGGLDSSLITVLGAAHAGPDFHGYTITYPTSDNRLDQIHADAPYARRLAKQLDLPLSEVEIGPHIATLWPSLIHYLDEPIADPAAITCYLISKLARESGTTVLLSGQGADELFGGYPRYAAMYLTGGLGRLPSPVRRVMARSAEWLPGAWGGRFGATMRRLRRLMVGLSESPDARFLGYCASTPGSAIQSVLSDEFLHEMKATTYADEDLAYLNARGYSGVNRYLDRDLSIYLPNHNLLYTDKMGMATGVETRVPLLDIELVDRVTQYPVHWKVARGRSKVILREAARDTVPQEIIERPKAGFGAPYRNWLRHDLGPLWNDLTTESSVARRGWFRADALQKIRQQSQQGHADLYMLQWAVLTIELWARNFIDANPSECKHELANPLSAAS